MPLRSLLSLLALPLAASAPAVPADDAPGLETVARLQPPPGNIAVTPGGRVIVSRHQFHAPEHAVLGLVADQRGIVWMADNGAPQPRIVAWDTRSDTLHRVITRPESAAPEAAFPHDGAVDAARKAPYLTDFGGPSRPWSWSTWRPAGRAVCSRATPRSPRMVTIPCASTARASRRAPARTRVRPTRASTRSRSTRPTPGCITGP